MSQNINFRRFDKNNKSSDLIYESFHKDLDHDFNSISMNKQGFNLVINVQNYTAESILIGGNLRTTPTRIQSLLRSDTRPASDYINSVIITILSSENTLNPESKKRNTHQQKTIIRIPGNLLYKGSVFVSELDCYVMTESQIDATRELIARDVSYPTWDSINLPSSMVKSDPIKLYVDYKQLSDYCIRHHDKIFVRTGIDFRHDDIPQVLKTLRIAIADYNFSPFKCYKMGYDPTLSPDEIIIENLYHSSNQEFHFRLSELEIVKSVYLDHNEIKTLFGSFYTMALFADDETYQNYVFERKTQQRFSEETLYVAERSGDPRLKEELRRLEKITAEQDKVLKETQEELKGLQTRVKEQKQIIKDRDETITKIKTHYDEKMKHDYIFHEVSNDHYRLRNESAKIAQEREELHAKEKQNKLQHKATILKQVSEILKSGWAIATACIGGVISIIALMKKYNIRLTVG